MNKKVIILCSVIVVVCLGLVVVFSGIFNKADVRDDAQTSTIQQSVKATSYVDDIDALLQELNKQESAVESATNILDLNSKEESSKIVDNKDVSKIKN